MAKPKLIPFDEVLDRVWGEIGTPDRDKMEVQIREELESCFMGEAIRKTRKGKHLTQAQLGELMGVQRAQVSKIESGKNLNIATVSRAFRAMGVPASFKFGDIQVALW